MACPTILPETEGGSCQMAGPTQDLLRSVSQSGSPTSWPRLYITSGRRPWAGGCLAHMSMGSSLRSPAAYSARGRTRMRTLMLMASPKAAPMPSSVTCEPRKAFVTLVGQPCRRPISWTVIILRKAVTKWPPLWARALVRQGLQSSMMCRKSFPAFASRTYVVVLLEVDFRKSTPSDRSFSRLQKTTLSSIVVFRSLMLDLLQRWSVFKKRRSRPGHSGTGLGQ